MAKVGLAFAAAFTIAVMVAAATAEARVCYRMACTQSQQCTANQQGPTGRCCCNVSCVGGEGGVTCTCSTWCTLSCGSPCPTCALCPSGRAAGDEGFALSKDGYSRVAIDHLLTAQVLENLTGRLTYPLYSGVAEGKSNADWISDYGYRVRVTATKARAVLEFAFEQTDSRFSPPLPVRAIIDEFGNVVLSSLSAEEVQAILAEADSECSAEGVLASLTVEPMASLPGRLVPAPRDDAHLR
jgi:hypothetical protein